MNETTTPASKSADELMDLMCNMDRDDLVAITVSANRRTLQRAKDEINAQVRRLNAEIKVHEGEIETNGAKAVQAYRPTKDQAVATALTSAGYGKFKVDTSGGELDDSKDPKHFRVSVSIVNVKPPKKGQHHEVENEKHSRTDFVKLDAGTKKLLGTIATKKAQIAEHKERLGMVHTQLSQINNLREDTRAALACMHISKQEGGEELVKSLQSLATNTLPDFIGEYTQPLLITDSLPGGAKQIEAKK